MIGQKKVIAVVVARGGSKGTPGKNVADLGGKPLVAWTVSAALAANSVDRVVLSSDDDEIIEAARTAGAEVPFRRPAALATDTSPVCGAVLHALDTVDPANTFDYVILLQATSPLRTGEDIDACVRLCEEAGAPSVISVTEVAKPPQWMFARDPDNRLEPLYGWESLRQQRQALPTLYLPNGAVYAARASIVREYFSFYAPGMVSYVMPPERSVDIDTAHDLALARALLP